MEANSQVKVLEDQIRECYGRLVWTYTTHQKCVDILEKKSKIIKISKIILNSISATGLISYIITNQNWLPMITIVFTTVALFLDIYTLSYDIDKEINSHIDMINKLWDIRESYLSLLVDMKINSIEIKEIKSKRDELQERLNKVYEEGPRTNPKAYKKASVALKINEDMTLHDEEIDLFLPDSLKRKIKISKICFAH